MPEGAEAVRGREEEADRDRKKFDALENRIAKLSELVEAQALLAAGLAADTIKAWSKDPQVPYEDDAGAAIKTSLFDSVEDTNSDVCLQTLLHKVAQQQ